MNGFLVTPRRKGFWIERVERDGKRMPVERHRTESEALARLAKLRKRAEMVERLQTAAK
jgi:hypothetical protein